MNDARRPVSSGVGAALVAALNARLTATGARRIAGAFPMAIAGRTVVRASTVAADGTAKGGHKGRPYSGHRGAKAIARRFAWALALAMAVALLAVPHEAAAQDSPDPAEDRVDGLIAAGTRAYEAEDWAAAAEAWAAALEAGEDAPALYDNLGSAYLAAGEPGRAALAFRRGLERAPRDRSLADGLARARVEAAAPTAASPDTVGAQLAAASRRWATEDELLLVLALGWGLAALAGYGAWRAERRGPRMLALLATGIGLLLFLGAGTVWLARRADERRAPRAVVLTTAELLPGPGEPLGEGFEVAPASEGRVLERQGRWLRVALSGGEDGWLPRHVLAPVRPGAWPPDGAPAPDPDARPTRTPVIPTLPPGAPPLQQG